MENANTLGITIFHDAPIADVFVANCTISFDDLVARNQEEKSDFWVCSPLSDRQENVANWVFFIEGRSGASRETARENWCQVVAGHNATAHDAALSS